MWKNGPVFFVWCVNVYGVVTRSLCGATQITTVAARSSSVPVASLESR